MKTLWKWLCELWAALTEPCCNCGHDNESECTESGCPCTGDSPFCDDDK